MERHDLEMTNPRESADTVGDPERCQLVYTRHQRTKKAHLECLDLGCVGLVILSLVCEIVRCEAILLINVHRVLIPAATPKTCLLLLALSPFFLLPPRDLRSKCALDLPLTSLLFRRSGVVHEAVDVLCDLQASTRDTDPALAQLVRRLVFFPLVLDNPVHLITGFALVKDLDLNVAILNIHFLAPEAHWVDALASPTEATQAPVFRERFAATRKEDGTLTALLLLLTEHDSAGDRG